MSRVITVSKKYPSYHPRNGEQTNFCEKIWAGLSYRVSFGWLCEINPHLPESIINDFWSSINIDEVFDPKDHTVRAGHRFKPGDWFSPRVWGNDINPKSGRSGPYHSKQIIIAPDIQVKNTFDFELHGGKAFFKRSGLLCEIVDEDLELIAKNDGLLLDDFVSWFHDFSNDQECQIICWNENIKY